MQDSGLFKLGYGVYVLTSKEEKDNGCIINAVMQVTQEPPQIMVAVNKTNLTHDYVRDSKEMNISILSMEADVDIFRQFGYQSGKTVDKFQGYAYAKRSENGLYYITKGTNAFLSAEVVKTVDCGSHSIFIGRITEDRVLNDEKAMSYADYHEFVKNYT